MFGLAIYSAYIYLHALNTTGQFRPSSQHVPKAVGNILITVAAVLGAAVWTWGLPEAPGRHRGSAPG